jgi:hypothetical protein
VQHSLDLIWPQYLNLGVVGFGWFRFSHWVDQNARPFPCLPRDALEQPINMVRGARPGPQSSLDFRSLVYSPSISRVATQLEQHVPDLKQIEIILKYAPPRCPASP